jgi:ComF family protein
VAGWLGSLADVVFPPVCVACRALPEGGGLRSLCPACERRLRFVRGRSAVQCTGPARALVKELKYHGGLHVAADMAEIIRRAPGCAGRVAGAVLVPVPLHPRKRRERGYNQSEVLARAIARPCGARGVADLLRRIVDTPSQTGLGRSARRANLKNAFALVPRPGFNPGQRHILVDDVFTTGFTINGCARTLRRSGCRKVDVITFCQG